MFEGTPVSRIMPPHHKFCLSPVFQLTWGAYVYTYAEVYSDISPLAPAMAAPIYHHGCEYLRMPGVVFLSCQDQGVKTLDDRRSLNLNLNLSMSMTPNQKWHDSILILSLRGVLCLLLVSTWLTYLKDKLGCPQQVTCIKNLPVWIDTPPKHLLCNALLALDIVFSRPWTSSC